MEQKTPLYDLHLRLSGKMVPFAGYLLPVQYATGVIAEHNAVRTACGLFDVSHMGEILFSGKDALNALQELLCNDMSAMDIGRVRYSPICNEQGGVVDDLVCCRMDENRYLLVVNAANKDKDFAWFKNYARGDVKIEDISDQYAQLALQGPKATDVLSKLIDVQKLPVKYYTFIDGLKIAGVDCLVSRTGYTGELGYELYCQPQKALQLAEALLQAGKEFGLIPCGLGARDTLRLEAGMPLYGHEMSDAITPYEAGLGLFVKMEKPYFIGKEALLTKNPPARIRIGLELIDRGIAREHNDIYKDELLIGETTSGTMAPYLSKAIAMAMVQKKYAVLGDVVDIDVRGKKLKAKIVELPFYKRAK
ncbi:MAG: glycine cleavage system aminomethyltransferase GcvT [Clostridiales bacterium]|nr:glycine cleavage system aminomethyltransferase GcvT [Clostridiales bacterium]